MPKKKKSSSVVKSSTETKRSRAAQQSISDKIAQQEKKGAQLKRKSGVGNKTNSSASSSTLEAQRSRGARKTTTVKSAEKRKQTTKANETKSSSKDQVKKNTRSTRKSSLQAQTQELSPSASKKSLPIPKSLSQELKPIKSPKPKEVTSIVESKTLILKPTNQPKKFEELSPFHRKQLQRLEELRDHILDQMQNQEQITRQRAEGSEASAFGMHQADAGSDSYDRDFALSLLSQEQDALYEIEEAIKRIYYGTYGICEMCGKEIPKARLEAIPYARFTVECQSIIEKENKGRRRWDSNTTVFMESPDLVDQESESLTEEEENRRE